MRARRWTKSEIDYLRDHSDQECIEHLGRTSAAVKSKRSTEHIPDPTSKRLWTQADDQILRDNAYKIPISELAEKLGRTEVATYARMRKLKLYGPQRWTRKQLDTLIDMAEQKRTVYEIAEAVGRTPSAVENKCILYNMPAIKHPEFYWTAEEEKTLRELNSQGYTVYEIADKMGRPYGGVKARGLRMGLRLCYYKPREGD